VRSNIEKFGTSAGKIWNVLSVNGVLNKKKILEKTKLNNIDFYIGLGWLARENKIYREDKNNYRLDNTNLTGEIGKDAGRIWKILHIWDEVDINSIKKLSGIKDYQIYSGIGWLAREDKLDLDEKKKFRLK
jgi:hypothetical protein